MMPTTPPWRRCFAWRPHWIHFELPPLGLGRVVWLRWYERRVEYRVYDIERDLACQMWVIRISAGAAIAAVLVLIGLLLTGSK